MRESDVKKWRKAFLSLYLCADLKRKEGATLSIMLDRVKRLARCEREFISTLSFVNRLILIIYIPLYDKLNIINANE